MVVSFGCASHMRCDEMLMLNVESVVTTALCTSPSFKRWGRLHRRASTAFKNASRVASGSKDAARHSSLACDLVRERFTSGLRCDAEQLRRGGAAGLRGGAGAARPPAAGLTKPAGRAAAY